MKPMPIRYVHDMGAARSFYEALGLVVDVAQRPPKNGPQPHWLELVGGAGALALHYVPAEATAPLVELAFDSDEPLEDVVKRLRAAGFEPETTITDEAFGRSFKVRDPDSLLLQINEHDRGLTS